MSKTRIFAAVGVAGLALLGIATIVFVAWQNRPWLTRDPKVTDNTLVFLAADPDRKLADGTTLVQYHLAHCKEVAKSGNTVTCLFRIVKNQTEAHPCPLCFAATSYRPERSDLLNWSFALSLSGVALIACSGFGLLASQWPSPQRGAAR